MSVVTVLALNGRRQNVKVTPNTTILQVLEEVCNKHGLKPEDYDIKHHNKILDVTTIFRFSGLPNNAQLELVEATKKRSESSLVLGMQMESGDRLTGEFVPSDTLWHVVKTLVPKNVNPSENPVVIYMRKEICGKENLEKTTLRSLGLTGGRAMLRFLQKTPEELKNQANVSAVISRPFMPEVKETKTSPKLSEKHEMLQKPKTNLIDQFKQELGKRNEEKKDERKDNVAHSSLDEKMEVDPVPAVSKSPKLGRVKTEIKPEPTKQSDKKLEVKTGTVEEKGDENMELESKVILLGERNAVAYNLNNIKTPVFEDVSDDFFELTVSDAKLLYKEAKKYCAELEEAPLMTAAQREFEHDKKVLSLLNQHKKTVLRIKFPDMTVLQGTFSPLEPISAVEKFVADYLENPKLEFYLYTTPPKRILKSEERLIDCDCVPCAIIYFGLNSQIDLGHYLRSEVLEKFSTPSAAALAAYQSRNLSEKSTGSDIKKEINSEPGPSKTQELKNRQKSDQGSSPPFKVPKWFKITK